MKCYLHEGVDAVGACETCSKGVCRDCAHEYAPPGGTTSLFCQNHAQVASLAGKVVWAGITVIAALMIYFMWSQGDLPGMGGSPHRAGSFRLGGR